MLHVQPVQRKGYALHHAGPIAGQLGHRRIDADDEIQLLDHHGEIAEVSELRR